jgi:hypothetical protein
MAAQMIFVNGRKDDKNLLLNFYQQYAKFMLSYAFWPMDMVN